jgi:DNA-binding NarL/FixJ family response regulator
MTIRVLIAGDQQLVRAGFRKLLDAEDAEDVEDAITVAGEAAEFARPPQKTPARPARPHPEPGHNR